MTVDCKINREESLSESGKASRDSGAAAHAGLVKNG
jgi:hypothetical protein